MNTSNDQIQGYSAKGYDGMLIINGSVKDVSETGLFQKQFFLSSDNQLVNVKT